jgi:F-type H+-transporting ATPase subunit gamma
VLLFYNETTSGTAFAPTVQQLLPLDRRWLAQLEEQTWPTRMIPIFRLDWAPLFAALVREYLFVSLYRAFAESLASEHSSRLAAMQVAQDNAEERLDDLQRRFHQRRQSAITEELLDIAAGAEALSLSPSPSA